MPSERDNSWLEIVEAAEVARWHYKHEDQFTEDQAKREDGGKDNDYEAEERGLRWVDAACQRWPLLPGAGGMTKEVVAEIQPET